MFGYAVCFMMLIAHYILLEDELKKKQVAKIVELTQSQSAPYGWVDVNRSLFLPDGIKRIAEWDGTRFIKYSYVEEYGKAGKLLETHS